MVNIKRTFNLFKEPHYKEDEVNLTRGFCSTICFLLSLLIGFSIIAAFLFQQERTFQVKVSTPTLQQYLDIEDFSPTCPCAKSLVQVKDVPALVNFIPSQATKECALDATATCDFISAVFNSVDEQALEAALTSNNQVEAGLGMWVEDVLGTANGFCFTTSSAAARIRSTFFATGVGASTLLNRDEFEDLMVSAVRVTAIDLSNSYSQTSTLLQNLASAGRIQQYAASRDLASLPAAQGKSSDNCTCSGDNAMPYCRFQLQIGGVLHDAGCGIPATVLGLQAKALDTTLYQASGLFASKAPKASSAEYTVHQGSLNQYLDQCDVEFFNIYASQSLNLPDAAFGEYYGECAPTTCNYVEVRTLTPTELITLILGLAGGLVAVMKAGALGMGKAIFRSGKDMVIAAGSSMNLTQAEPQAKPPRQEGV